VEHVATPMSRYPKFKREGLLWAPPWEETSVCVVTSEDGTFGVGMTVFRGNDTNRRLFPWRRPKQPFSLKFWVSWHWGGHMIHPSPTITHWIVWYGWRKLRTECFYTFDFHRLKAWVVWEGCKLEFVGPGRFILSMQIVKGFSYLNWIHYQIRVLLWSWHCPRSRRVNCAINDNIRDMHSKFWIFPGY
jgi:hypothetical protein